MGTKRWSRLSIAVMTVSLLTACSGSSTPSSGAPSSSQSAALPAERDIETTHAMKINAAPSPDWALVAGGHVWVAGVEPGLARYDTATGQRQGGLPIQDVCLAMDVGFGSLWAASCTPGRPMLHRVDVNSGRLMASVELPDSGPAEESSVGAGEGGVWVLSRGVPQHLIVVDPSSNKVLRIFPAPENAAALRVGLGGVWVTTNSGNLVRLDPGTGMVIATIPVGEGARFLALSSKAVWVMNQQDGTVSRVDPASNGVVATIKVSSAAIDGGDIAASDRAVWVRVSDVLAAKIDPQTNKVIDRLGPPAGSGSVAIAEDSVWITAHDVTSLWRVPQP
jgi:virginiamycin B lyase